MSKKILIVITNHSAYPTKKEKTGLWFAELVHFYDLLASAGYKMDFASPQGGAVPIDPTSLGKVFLDGPSRARRAVETNGIMGLSLTDHCTRIVRPLRIR